MSMDYSTFILYEVVWTDGNYQVDHTLPNIDVNMNRKGAKKNFETMKQYQFNKQIWFSGILPNWLLYSFENLQSK